METILDRNQLKADLEYHKTVRANSDRRIAALSSHIPEMEKILIEHVTREELPPFEFSPHEAIAAHLFARAFRKCRQQHKCSHACKLGVMVTKKSGTVTIGVVKKITEDHIFFEVHENDKDKVECIRELKEVYIDSKIGSAPCRLVPLHAPDCQ